MRKIEIEVTLVGGQTLTAVLSSDSPLLHDLYAGLANSRAESDQRPEALIQFPVEEGHAAASFMASSIVSIMSKPAVLLQLPTHATGRTHAPVAFATAPYVLIEDFLTPAENEQILQYAIENEREFTGSRVYNTPDADGKKTFRKSRVLFSIKDSRWKPIFVERLKLHLPHIATSLGFPAFRFVSTEIQLTASNVGDFFKRHADADLNNEHVAPRMLTFVYYLSRSPEPFLGGDLLLYGADPGGPVAALPPRNNRLVCFRSETWHEVDLVQCQSRDFADSRFTVNGWLRCDGG